MKDVTVFVFKASLGVYVEVVVIIQCEMDLILAMLLTIVDKINESLCKYLSRGSLIFRCPNFGVLFRCPH